MAWLQDNWIIAVVGLVVAVLLLWVLFGRKKPEATETPLAPAEPRKPLEAVKPEIVAAEPARFKPREPASVPVTAPPAAPAPVAEAPPARVPAPSPEPEPAVEIPEEPTVSAEPVAETPAPAAPKPAPQPEPTPKPAPDPEPAVVIPEEPTVPPPPPEPVAAPEPAPAPATKADNLQLLKGLGPKMVVLLNGLGVTSFRQIAEWTDADIAAIDPQLGAFQGRIVRDNLVDQANYLAQGDKAGFEAKYGALGGEL
ncbi:hypothetical protein [Sphingopyxis sp.]|uniref:hypothetical protein n=1 Tax=Sphingopyxis sp. TaxID=1908224 RepID=UPI003BA84FB6